MLGSRGISPLRKHTRTNTRIIKISFPLTPRTDWISGKFPGMFYQWLGFEAYQLVFDFLNEIADDQTLRLDCFAYDLNEPGIVGLLEKNWSAVESRYRRLRRSQAGYQRRISGRESPGEIGGAGQCQAHAFLGLTNTTKC